MAEFFRRTDEPRPREFLADHLLRSVGASIAKYQDTQPRRESAERRTQNVAAIVRRNPHGKHISHPPAPLKFETLPKIFPASWPASSAASASTCPSFPKTPTRSRSRTGAAATGISFPERTVKGSSGSTHPSAHNRTAGALPSFATYG